MQPVTKTTCAYCGVGCGIEVERFGDIVELRGDKQHPANRGALCAKGSQLGQTVGLEGRLLKPKLNGADCEWETALDEIATRFQAARDKHGPGAVAMYVSGQLLTEDYYVANKFMKGAMGSANIDTNSRLCMASSVAAYKRAFGADAVPCGYDDVEQAELVVLVGSNLAWCHPVLYRRLHEARSDGSGPVVVAIDPRRTATAADADLHLAVKPGSDSLLFNGLLAWLAAKGETDQEFICHHTDGFDAALDSARNRCGLTDIASQCGLDGADVEAFFRLFAESGKVVTVYSQGINQSSVGTDKANAIINVHLATGKLGKPGCGPFSITGQPNAMGGREVGGLATQLAAHMAFDDESVDIVRRFWGFDDIARRPGLAAVQLFDALSRGEIKALWIMGTNPAVSMPAASKVREALDKCEFLVVSDCIEKTDTTHYADVLLPALAWGEKDGTVTNSERCISRQRGFLRPPGEARADWWAIAEVAKRSGFRKAFSYESPADIFREHAALSGFENGGSRDFDISVFSELANEDYEQLAPTYWPCPAGGPATEKPSDLFAGHRYFTATGKAQFVAVATSGTAASVSAGFPLMLNSGRIRDQWHTMTRTARAPALNQHTPEPRLTLNPLDARRYGIGDGRLVRVCSRHGNTRLRAHVSRTISPGQSFIPMHWSAMNSSSILAGVLFGGQVDPHSLQPELKAEPVNVVQDDVLMHGVEIVRNGESVPLPEDAGYFVETCFNDCVVRFLGFDAVKDDWGAWAAERVGAADEVLTMATGPGRTTVAALADGRLRHLLVLDKEPRSQDAAWLAALFREADLSRDSRQSLLRGSPARCNEHPGTGKVVCACFGTTEDTVAGLEQTAGARTAELVGSMTGAGTNCGSCLPELREMLDTVPEMSDDGHGLRAAKTGS